MGWTAVPSTPSSANRTFVGCTVSALHRPTGRAVIPSPSVTVAVVRWWVIIAVVRRPRVIILRLGRHECAKRDCANAANSQEYSRCTQCVAPPIFSSWRDCLPLSWSRQCRCDFAPVSMPARRFPPPWSFRMLGSLLYNGHLGSHL